MYLQSVVLIYADGEGPTILLLYIIHMKYVPQNPIKKIALIGKGLCFDSGGLDLKPANSMLTMRDDMSGAACV